ncbi:MAG: ExeM/NucH family extracellular endonuclease, partial [Pseudomonadales bacterium]
VWTGPSASTFAPSLIVSEPEPEERLIHEVQGSGAASPLVGDRVIIEGIVVADFEEGDDDQFLRGFNVQEEDVDADADPATSEGIFVFNFSNDDVSVGDLVRVEGTADEFGGNTQLTDFVEVEVLSSGNTLPTPATVHFPLASAGALEAVEGMHATFPDSLAIIEYFNYDRFGEVVVGLPLAGEDRHNQATSVFDTGTPEAADLAAYNALNRITIDDLRTGQNPEFSIHPGNGEEYTLDNTFRGGDTITGITGAIYSAFGLYRVMPTVYGEYVKTNIREDAPQDVGGRLTVASFNALNYFLTVDAGGSEFDVCGPNQDQDCRGADSNEEFERQRVKLLAALLGLDADIVGLIELENTPGVEVLADIVKGLNAQLGRRIYGYVAAGDNNVVGTDAIKVGFIYKRRMVRPIGKTAILDDPSFLDPNNTGQNKNRAALAQTFVQKRGRAGARLTVVVNHLKSKGSGCGVGDDDPEAGSCNLTRTLAAEALLDWLDTRPTRTRDPDYLIIGDLNSYDEEDPIDALVSAGYTDLVKAVEGELAYSFVFSGQFGYLDYALSNASLTPQITGVTTWHINADEPDLLDYNTDFRGPVQQALYEPNAFRSSDHDPVVIGLKLKRKHRRYGWWY